MNVYTFTRINGFFEALFFLQKTKDSKPAQMNDSQIDNSGEASSSTLTSLDVITTQSVPVQLMPSQSSQVKVWLINFRSLLTYSLEFDCLPIQNI